STIEGTIVTPSQTNITSVGTIGTGVWNGTAINQTYLVGQSGTNTGDQTLPTDFVSAASGGTFSGNVSFGDNNITNVGDISLDSISSDAGTSINVVLGSDAGDDFTVDTSKLVVEGDTGRIGIGTASPDEILEIEKNDTVYLHLDGTTAGLKLDKNAAVNMAYVFYQTNGSTNWFVGVPASGDIGDGTDFNIGTSSSASDSKFFIDSGTGKVGIGTTGPEENLHVSGSGIVEIKVQSSNDDARFHAHASDGQPALLTLSSGVDNSTDSFTLSVDPTAKDLRFIPAQDPGDAPSMVILQDGKVGIGTNDPGSELHIYDSSNTQVYIDSTTAGSARLLLDSTNSGGEYSEIWFRAGGGEEAKIYSDYSQNLYFKTGTTLALTLNSSQNATFAGSVTIGSSNSDWFTGGNLNIDSGQLYANSDTHKVGIGTTNPDGFFEVTGG
ncbi:MAG: hypothetical protein QF535_05175, partial [Anaerolineales bacterium]|nr:hypothetical protein [Anaerolineales bacterium]